MVPHKRPRAEDSPLKVKATTRHGLIVAFGVSSPYDAWRKCRELDRTKYHNLQITCPMRTTLMFKPSMACTEVTDWLYHGR